MKGTRLALVLFIVLSVALAGCETGDKTATPITGPGDSGDRKWSYLDQADPNAPTLIETGKAESALHLKPDWEVSTIEYVDAWWGLGGTDLHDQWIKREGTTYKLNGAEVSTADVQALVKAIEHLYPAQMLMQGHAWTDDYPSWTVEMTGTDGQHILLYASSTGNPGNGPWNVLYNGLLYAQYDGSIARPLGKLFGGRLGTDNNPFPDSGRPTNEVNFATIGLPPQLTYGFWGLLPISQDFSYAADLTKGEVKGQVTGSSRIGSMEIGDINKLDSLQLTVGGNPVSCKVEQLPEGDPFTARIAWEFTCPVQGAKEGERYNYPLKAHFTRGNGESLDVTGELWGKWTPRDYILLPPPPELKEAISHHPAAQDLMTDHIVGSTRYSATLTSDKPLSGRRGGEAILYGQTQVDGKTVRYTVGAQFVIQDGKLTYWDLDRAALDDILKAITAQALTGRVLAAKSDLVLNLWYAKGTPPQERSFMNDGPDAYKVSVNSCGAVPGGAFPGGKPLQAFAYNSSPYFDRPPFVLIEGKTVASELAFAPGEADEAQKVLVPDALDTGASKPFEFISMATTSYSGGGPTLRLRIPEKASAEERAIYDERIKALPAPARDEDSMKVIAGVTLALDEDGKLNVVSCAASQQGLTPQPTDAKPPTVVYATYYGSTGNEERHSTSGDALAIDAAGNAYITGMTSSSSLTLKDPYDSSHSGSLWDGYIAKLDPDGSSLLYGTYFGSGDETVAEGIAVDAEGNIYVTGSAYSGFNTQDSSIQSSSRGQEDAFIAKFSADGKKLIYSTLLGGSDYDTGSRIAADKEGNAYVIGSTRSKDFHTERPIQAKFGGMGEEDREGDAFIAKISPDGSKLIYSTYLGGKGADGSYGILADAEGNAYVTGFTTSDDFPVANALQPKAGGSSDAFLTKISPDGSRLVYSTLLGGKDADVGANLAIGNDGAVYLTGNTASQDFPLKNPLYSTFNGGVLFSGDQDHIRDAFVAKVDAQGKSLLYSTFLGGTGEDRGRGIGLDTAGNIYVGGSTTSNDFPLVRPIQKQYAGASFGLAPDSFITKLNPSGSNLIYSTYFGGDGFDDLLDFAVNPNGDVYFVGAIEAPSPDFPLAGRPFQSTNSGIRSAFIVKIAGETP